MKIPSLFLLLVLSTAILTASCKKEDVKNFIPGFRISPNPASSVATIYLGQKTSSISISNNVSTVYHINLDGYFQVMTLNVADWPSGVYEVSITTPDGVYNDKFVVISD